MPYLTTISTCYCCSQPFTYNLDLVPCIRINGVREPICSPCIQHANTERAKLNLSPFYVKPGAYESQEV